jgi:glutamate-1-semialdehyde 2,1-aminomutase
MLSTDERSRALVDEAARYIPGGVSSAQRRVEPNLAFTRAEGAYLFDADGKRYIDYHAAFGPALLGHCHPEVNARVAEAIGRIDLTGAGPGDLEVALARKLVQHVPSAERVLFCSSGSEATLHALQLARAATGRRKLVKFQGCYHGWHDAVLTNATGRPLSAGMHPAVVADTIVLPYNDLDRVRETIEREGSDIAAVIVEPVAHNMGAVLPRAGFLEGLRELTAAHGVVLIFDEVVTGFRHGLGGYQAVAGVTPDLSTFAKAIANGFPIAALCGRADLMDRCGPDGDVFFAGTFNAHPGSVAAALATIELLERPGAYERLFALGERLRSGLREIAGRAGVEATVAGFGSVFALYFLSGEIAGYDDLGRNDDARDLAFRRGLIERGMYLLPVPLKRGHLSLAHTEGDIDATLAAAEAVLEAFA